MAAPKAMKTLGNLTAESTVFFLCDMQEKFRPAIQYFTEIVEVAKRLTATSRIMNIPLVVTEQYPNGLGSTVTELDIAHAVGVFPKTKFSMVLPPVEQELLKRPNVKAIVLYGIEAHVCVQQTAIDLLSRGLDVHVVADACSSRCMMDRQFAYQGWVDKERDDKAQHVWKSFPPTEPCRDHTAIKRSTRPQKSTCSTNGLVTSNLYMCILSMKVRNYSSSSGKVPRGKTPVQEHHQDKDEELTLSCGDTKFPRRTSLRLDPRFAECNLVSPITEEEAVILEEKTRGQAGCLRWFKAREKRLTASHFGNVVKRRKAISETYLANLFDNKTIRTQAVLYGLQYETAAKEAYLASRPWVHVHECGFVVNPQFSFLGATPDGKVCDGGRTGILEIKCPYTARNMDVVEAVASLPQFYMVHLCGGSDGISGGSGGINNRISRVSDGISGVNNGISSVNDEISAVSDKISGVSNRINHRISGVNDGISAVSDRISGVSNRINHRISGVSNGISVVSDRISVVSDRISGVSDRINNRISRVSDGISRVGDKTNDGPMTHLALKKNHSYYYQAQGQLMITGASFCDFVVFTKKGIHVHRISPDRELWKTMLEQLAEFYCTHAMPYFIQKGI